VHLTTHERSTTTLHAPAPHQNQAGHLRAVRADAGTPGISARGPLLAVWPEPDLHPSRLLAKLIEHYSDPGDLVLADGKAQAIALGLRRRVIASDTRDGGPTVRHLPQQELARLALVTMTGTNAADLDTVLPRLAPDSFVALLPTCDPTNLGRLVQSAANAGLGYWQHIVAFNPANLDNSRGRARRDIVVLRSDKARVFESSAAVAA
jgi:hypothetical protein